MDLIQFSSLKYYNSCISEECLYVGMLFHNITTGERCFKTIKKLSRLEAFDDEVDIDFFKSYLKSIKDEVEDSIFNYGKEFDLESYIKLFVNELRFSKIIITETDDPKFTANMSKLYLKFDYEKRERMNNKQEKKYIDQILSNASINYSKIPMLGSYDEKIRYDFQTDKYAIKVFYFKDKDLIRLMSSAKAWSFSAEEMREKLQTVFLYDLDVLNSPNFKSIINVLKKNAKVMTVQDGLDFILSKSASIWPSIV